ncbi:hypothetical protein [Streptomyces rhizosphaericus]|uniref:DUF4126 domain-containing protein n=2 Tax=Streptomyces violaceusniger group TaxID=2839105 RepID=A0ABN1QH67_9ACTN|nr:hypothetical protein [Streptomyces cangkringensis]
MLTVSVVGGMTQGGNTMGEEPTWAELLLVFAVAGVIPIVIGGAVIFSLVGLAMWVTAPLRRRRRNTSDGV